MVEVAITIVVEVHVNVVCLHELAEVERTVVSHLVGVTIVDSVSSGLEHVPDGVVLLAGRHNGQRQRLAVASGHLRLISAVSVSVSQTHDVIECGSNISPVRNNGSVVILDAEGDLSAEGLQVSELVLIVVHGHSVHVVVDELLDVVLPVIDLEGHCEHASSAVVSVGKAFVAFSILSLHGHNEVGADLVKPARLDFLVNHHVVSIEAELSFREVSCLRVDDVVSI